ncbi:ribonuclease H-like domain-containing protein [Tanacetum coccineum]
MSMGMVQLIGRGIGAQESIICINRLLELILWSHVPKLARLSPILIQGSFVANGSTQQLGVDCDDTFSLAVKSATIHTVLSLALSRNWLIHQLDVENAFLNGNLSKTIYMYQPPGFVDVHFPHHVCQLQRRGIEVAYLLIYVDDIILTASSTDLLQRIISSLLKEFDMTDLGKAHMATCNPTRTLVDTESKLGSDGDPVCLHMHDPREPHFATLKRVLRYVHGTLDFRLQLNTSSTGSLIAYSDADWAGCPTTRRSTSGYYVFLGDKLLSCLASNLILELHTPLLYATIVYYDNVSAIYLTANPVQHQRTKHIEIDIHFVHNMVARGQPLSLSFDFVFASEIFKSLSFRLDRLYRLAILYLDQHAHTLHHLESLLTISLDRLDIFEGRSCISEFVRKSLSLILELS